MGTEIQKTKPVREALELANLLIETDGAAVGEIVGETGNQS